MHIAMTDLSDYDGQFHHVVFSCDHPALRTPLSLCPSVRPSVPPSVCYTFFHNVSVIVSWNFHEWLPSAEVMSMQKVKDRCHGSKVKVAEVKPNLAVSGPQLKFEFTCGDEMMQKARRGIREENYCFSRSSVKVQGHTGQKIIDFDQNWAFPDCNSRLNTLMAMKWYTKLKVA